MEKKNNIYQKPYDNYSDFLLEKNKRYMNNIAISMGNRKITFEEMHQRIDEYAKALSKRGIGENDVVAVCLANSPEAIFTMYALNKLGATIVGLSLFNNEYKMARDLEMTKPTAVITVDFVYQNLKKSCEELGVNPIVYSPMDGMNNPLLKAIYNHKQKKAGNFVKDKNQRLKNIVNTSIKGVVLPEVEHDYESVTDIMFTGGSTGTHKAVLLNDGGLNRVVETLDDVFILEPGMKHLGNIPFGHMSFGRMVLHYCLSHNIEYAITLNPLPDKFLDEMIRTQCDGAMGGPVHWNSLIGNPKVKSGVLENLKQAISGGEMYVPEQKRKVEDELQKAGANIKIGNGYGLTEAWAAVNVEMEGKPGIVGRPSPGIIEKVVDPETFERVEKGKPGLLFIQSPGTMIGFSDKEETKKALVYDSEGKWLNSGDIVTELESGEFIFAGRKKRNFVSGVDNIYPEQIEQIIGKLPEIKEIAVTKMQDEQEQYLPVYHILLKDAGLVAYDKEELENKINKAISITLGKSAAPGYIVYYDKALPRTENGKLNATLMEKEFIESDKPKIRKRKM